jgi:predicted glycosyl hydrolase (DUF1957 family)
MDIVRAEYNKLHDSKVITISSADIADRAYKVIDPEPKAPPLAQFAAYLQLEEMATKLRQKRRKIQIGPEPLPLFEGLQKRYCIHRHGEYVDILREDLTLQERRQISARLRAQAKADTSHATALDAETEELLKAGLLREEKQA